MFKVSKIRNKSDLFNIIQIVLLIILCILNILLFNIQNYWLFSLVLILFLAFIYYIIGFKKNNYRNKKDVFYIIITSIVIYIIATYLLGLFFGFVRNSYSLKFINIVKNVFPYLILIIIRELYRYIYYNKNKINNTLKILGFLFFVLFDICLNLNIYSIYSLDGLFKIICLVIFPSISKNIFLNYITMNYGYNNTIIYSLIMELNKFILPIFPNLGEYLETIVVVLFPLYLRTRIIKLADFKEKRKIYSNRKKNIILYSIASIIIIIIIMLTSGKFKYYAVTIGSSSMEPNISKGDVVVVKKISDYKKIMKGDILAYHYSGKLIVHRLVDVKILNGNRYYVTKGDNNINNDGYLVPNKDIVGIVSFKIKYIGYPTVELNEKMKKE